MLRASQPKKRPKRVTPPWLMRMVALLLIWVFLPGAPALTEDLAHWLGGGDLHAELSMEAPSAEAEWRDMEGTPQEHEGHYCSSLVHSCHCCVSVAAFHQALLHYQAPGRYTLPAVGAFLYTGPGSLKGYVEPPYFPPLA